VLKRVLVILISVSLLTIFVSSPAHAGDAGRWCKTYYHLNDPSTGWGFTVCVKLQHDPNTHSWRSNTTVSTTTFGLYLYMHELDFYMDGNDVVPVESHGLVQGYSSISTQTPWHRCNGGHLFLGRTVAQAIWPNNTLSSKTYTWTSNNEWFGGTC
jgi:hypothetical protein